MEATLSALRTEGSSKRLEQISKLRARGIGEHVNLPQLVVCGDQSAGKSSVLEGVTGLPFPRQEGLCTRFATEITLTHSEGPLTTEAEVIPDVSRTEESKQRISRYKRKLGKFDELPEVITEVGELIELQGPKFPTGPSFSNDVLRIKVSGTTGLHLTVVDLPGLISVASEEQTEDDVKTVHELVNRYLENKRTIILAVVQASNDIANQGIIQKSKRHDSQGVRTVGIITKPDLINPGTESLIAALAKNQGSTKLKLGFFIVKNPSPADRAILTTSDVRARRERDYFSSSPWKELRLDMERVGVVALRTYLQRLLDRHIERELPAVRDSIEAFLKQTDKDIVELGEERPTSADVRRYLTRVANRFHGLAEAALSGSYHNVDVAFFAGRNESQRFIRLRALVHELNTEFSQAMAMYGSTCRVTQEISSSEGSMDDSDVTVPETYTSSNDIPDPYEKLKQGQRQVRECDMHELVTKMYRETRGPELPGNYNHVLLAELFRYQSEKWKAFAVAHLDNVASYLIDFVQRVVAHVNNDERVKREMVSRIRNFLAKNKSAAEAELNKICTDKDAHPLTYNHYYTDNVQKARNERVQKKLKTGTELIPEYDLNSEESDFWWENVVDTLTNAITVNMDEQGVAEARIGLEAYYKVARKTFVDNVCVQVIERHLLRNLPSAFSAETVAELSDDELKRIAGEDETTVSKRKELRALYEDLLESLQDLQQV